MKVLATLPALGDRLYVKPLDVFGRVTGVRTTSGDGRWVTVQCEWPMPGYEVDFRIYDLYKPDV
jgi:hypothetical protein